MCRILFALSIFCFTLLFSQIANSQSIEVFAGNDTTICQSSTLSLADINSEITGGTSDGNWLSSGDGLFLPNATSFHRYSTAVSYVPGPTDKFIGSFDLILVSDDPDDIGPLTEQSDQLTVILSSGLNLFCNSNINVSLDGDCQQLLSPQLLLANSSSTYGLYNVISYDALGQVIPDNLLNGTHIGQNINYSIVDVCNGNSCWGEIAVHDRLAPTFVCTDMTVSCEQDYSPESVGFPIATTASVDTIINNVYQISDMDACGIAYVSYEDVEEEGACNSDTSKIITRQWLGVDTQGNQSFCTQSIYLLRMDISDITLPDNYDDITSASLECQGSWPALFNGHPSPDTTGYPVVGLCDYLGVTYSDIELTSCGNTYRLLREWRIVEWCSSTVTTHIQIIHVSDSEAPSISCPQDITLSTFNVSCQSDIETFAIQRPVDLCSTTSAYFEVYNSTNISIYKSTISDFDRIEIPNLSLGKYRAVITSEDLCGNEGSCTFEITVIDHNAPYAVCDRYSLVTLTSSGTGRLYAASLDDGSFDGCSSVSFQVRKSMNACEADTSYNDFVDFCCAEIGTRIDVALLVTDLSGNTNECTIQVDIEDQINPTIYCPPDITISCDTPFDVDDLSTFGRVVSNQEIPQAIFINDALNSGVIGYDGLYSDNCEAFINESYTSSFVCNRGTLFRTFTVSDGKGFERSCTQTITIINNEPFSGDDINWPSDRVFNGCSIDMNDLEVAGQPLFSASRCANVAATYSDQEFITTDGACSGIIRSWEVLDWCEYDGNRNTALWSHTQVIKQYNIIAPTIESSYCQDTSLCIIEGCEIFQRFVFEAQDDCSAAQDLSYNWSLDINADSIIDTMGITNEFGATFQQGEHIIYWNVEDGCGNLSSCSRRINVKDCKEPSPYCMSEITTVIMSSSEGVAVWAEDFNLNTSDNCDEASDLVFGFDESLSQSYRIFTCNDLTNGVSEDFSLNLWVSDVSGNKDFCSITVTIQDNEGDFCEDNIQEVLLSGTIQNPDQYIPSGTEIIAIDENFNQIKTLLSSDATFELSLFSDQQYIISCVNQLDYGLGVSALDILLIQKHILNIKPFNDPYKMIAADVNNSASISAIDLVELQKLVLGLVDTLKHSNSWKFVPAQFEFDELPEPWPFEESLALPIGFDSNSRIDFMAVKMGDVNESLQNVYDDGIQIENRDSGTSLKFEIKDDLQHLYLDMAENVDGLQIAFKVDPEIVGSLRFEKDLEYHYSEGILRILWTDPLSYNDNGKIPLFSFALDVLNNIEVLDLDDFQSFYILDDTPYAIKQIQWETTTFQRDDQAFDVYPNPFDESLNINLPDESYESVIIIVSDINGNTILKRAYENQNSFIILKSDLQLAGLYHLNIITNTRSFYKKVILQY